MGREEPGLMGYEDSEGRKQGNKGERGSRIEYEKFEGRERKPVANQPVAQVIAEYSRHLSHTAGGGRRV